MDSSSVFYKSFVDLLHLHCWGEQCALYHAESGDTHVLNKMDLDILQRINKTPASAKDLAMEFEQMFDGGAAQYVQTLLSNLAELGLIETIDNEPAH
jgi:PqqD family protein of HPr-rel-A system